MNKTELEKFKKILEKQLSELQMDARREVPKSDRALADVNDQATLESERSFELRLKDRDRKLINKVQEALRKIKDGGYGTCVSCSEPISVKRLQARPVTDLCISCKSEMEADERREETTAQATQSSADSDNA